MFYNNILERKGVIMKNKKGLVTMVLIFGFGIIIGIIMGIRISVPTKKNADENKAIVAFQEQIGFVQFEEDKLNSQYLAELMMRGCDTFMTVNSENEINCLKALIGYFENIFNNIPDTGYEFEKRMYSQAIDDFGEQLKQREEEYEKLKKLKSQTDEIINSLKE